MKNLPITLTLPENIIRDLHLYISKRQISKFVAQMLKEALENKKKLLIKELQEAARDEERNREIELWDTLNDEGINETNPY